jgi:mono/diheme cytochrome c family protein
MKRLMILIALAAPLTPALAETPASQLQQLSAEAKAANPGFSGFSAARGQQFFTNRHGNDWSCASCHTVNPMQSGKHDVTGKVIRPMAPAANPERFTDAAKSAKWFRRNCKDVVGRECTALEKGDILAWLISLK